MNIRDETLLYIYSTQTKNNKWNCKRTYKIPDYIRPTIFGISKYNKLYFRLSNGSIYQFDLITEKIKECFTDEVIVSKVDLSSNENLDCLITCWAGNKTFIYSIELEIPVLSLDIILNPKHSKFRSESNGKFLLKLIRILHDIYIL
jgi:hypothetical protein